MAWYNDDIQQVPADFRHLFENYSGIPSEDVVAHVNKIVSLILPASSMGDHITDHSSYKNYVPINIRDRKLSTSAHIHVLDSSNSSS